MRELSLVTSVCNPFHPLMDKFSRHYHHHRHHQCYNLLSTLYRSVTLLNVSTCYFHYQKILEYTSNPYLKKLPNLILYLSVILEILLNFLIKEMTSILRSLLFKFIIYLDSHT